MVQLVIGGGGLNAMREENIACLDHLRAGRLSKNESSSCINCFKCPFKCVRGQHDVYPST